MFFTGDLNAHSQFWWPEGHTTNEDTNIEELFTNLGLSQVISELTNFEPHYILMIFIKQYFSTFLKLLDKVWHEGLVFKLAQNGILGNLLKLFQNYLNNRKQGVVLNGSFSEYSKIASVVPQGSILCPLLFLIYINDLEKHRILIFCG